MSGQWLHLAVEDALSEAVARRLLSTYRSDFDVIRCYGRNGSGLLRKRIGSWNQAAKRLPFLVLTDLDRDECAPTLIRTWLPEAPHPNLLLRVAVREVEAWLLADRLGWSEFLGLERAEPRSDVETLTDPKSALIESIRKCRRRDLREDLLPAPRTTARVGPNYNGRLIEFVESTWRPEEARKNADSLDRMIQALGQGWTS